MDVKKKTAADLRQMLLTEDSPARNIINSLFDEGTFVELGAYVKRSKTEFDNETIDCDFEGVITGYGAVNGHLTYAFIQDFTRMKGALSEAYAKKIISLYDTALNNNAPLIGVFDSAGAFITEGIGALSGYGSIMRKAAYASGIIPQVAVITGVCSGAAAIIANMFDIKIGVEEKGAFYINSPFIIKEKFKDKSAGTIKNAAINGIIDVVKSDTESAVECVKELLAYLPANAINGTNIDASNDDVNRLTFEIDGIIKSNDYDMKQIISVIADENNFFELSSNNAEESFTGFVRLNGSVIGVAATRPNIKNGALSAKAALKIKNFIDFCNSFKIPLLTLVDTNGYDISVESENTPYSYALAELAASYSLSDNAKVTVIVGKAYGSSFTLLGSKKLGTDIVYALDTAKISIMEPEAAVRMVWNDQITKSDDPVKTKAELLDKWNDAIASPLEAAKNGDIDDIISFEELRQRIAAAFEMLAFKNGG